LLESLKATDQDYEWYPTTARMVDEVIEDVRRQFVAGREWRRRDEAEVSSVLDIGAGDGRVLVQFQQAFRGAELFSIEKSALLRQAQPEAIAPVGTDVFEQDLMSLPAQVVFCNPPYSEYEEWVIRIVSSAMAETIYLVIPQRWEANQPIAEALSRRHASATVIARDDFHDAERQARAIVHIVRVELPKTGYHGTRGYQDPFELWFDEHVKTFDEAQPIRESEQEERTMARLRTMTSIGDLVDAYDEDFARMQQNYETLFRLDQAILKEVGVNKTGVRDGLKQRMIGLKTVYWNSLFEQLDALTARLSTKTRNRFKERVAKQTSVAFTYANAYAVVLWAIKFANRYFDEQLVDLFRELSTRDGVTNYKSNTKTWESDGWRYNATDHSHYALDYRVILPNHAAIFSGNWGEYDYPGHLHKTAHELIDDVIAVFGNLGFTTKDRPSRQRVWLSNVTQVFAGVDGDALFDVKAFKKGTLHFRFRPQAIKALNIEAGRLLGWLRTAKEAAIETGCSEEDAVRFFGANQLLTPSAVRLLTAPAGAVA
jgi:hypothetical protein